MVLYFLSPSKVIKLRWTANMLFGWWNLSNSQYDFYYCSHFRRIVQVLHSQQSLCLTPETVSLLKICPTDSKCEKGTEAWSLDFAFCPHILQFPQIQEPDFSSPRQHCLNLLCFLLLCVTLASFQFFEGITTQWSLPSMWLLVFGMIHSYQCIISSYRSSLASLIKHYHLQQPQSLPSIYSTFITLWFPFPHNPDGSSVSHKKVPHTGGLNNSSSFSYSSRGWKSSAGCRQGWFLLSPLSLSCRAVSYPCVLTSCPFCMYTCPHVV